MTPGAPPTSVLETESRRGLGGLVSVIIRNAAASWTGYLANMAIAFFLTPFVLHSLGDVRYGIWSIVVGLTGYYGLLDLGFRLGLNQYLARQLAVKDFKGLNETASTGFVAMSCCGAAVLLLSLAVGGLAPAIWDISAANRDEVRLAIVLVGVGFAVQFTFFVYSSVFNATMRQDLANAIALLTRILTAVATVFVLRAGHGLPTLALVLALGSVVEYAIRIPIAYRILPELKIRLRNANWATGRQLAGFGSASVMIQIGSRLIFYSDALVIGALMPAAAIAPFALASGLVVHFGSLFTPVGWVLSPAFAGLSAKGDRKNVGVLYLEATRVMALVAGLVAVVAALLANPFFRLWVGPAYLEANRFGSASALFVVLLVAATANATQRVAYQVFLGFLQPWRLARYVVAEAIANLVFSVTLIRPFGLFGVALGTVLPAIAFNCVVIPRAACRLAGVSVGAYVSGTIVRPSLAAAFTLAGGRAVGGLVPADTWLGLVARTVVIGVWGLVMAVFAGLSREDRRRLLGRIRRRLGSRA